MSGPAFEPEATLALPTAKIAVMGPEAAVNAVFANKIAAIEDEEERVAFVEEQRRLYEEDVDLLRLASELVIDGDRGVGGRCAPRCTVGWCGPGQEPPLLVPSPRRARRSEAPLMPWCERLRPLLHPVDADRRR